MYTAPRWLRWITPRSWLLKGYVRPQTRLRTPKGRSRIILNFDVFFPFKKKLFYLFFSDCAGRFGKKNWKDVKESYMDNSIVVPFGFWILKKSINTKKEWKHTHTRRLEGPLGGGRGCDMLYCAICHHSHDQYYLVDYRVFATVTQRALQYTHTHTYTHIWMNSIVLPKFSAFSWLATRDIISSQLSWIFRQYPRFTDMHAYKNSPPACILIIIRFSRPLTTGLRDPQ